MKIARKGRLRDAGTDILSAQSFADAKANWRRPKWNKGTGSVTVEITGTDRGNNYVYTVHLPPTEILVLLQTALDVSCADRAEKAVAASSIAAIQELLAGLGEA